MPRRPSLDPEDIIALVDDVRAGAPRKVVASDYSLTHECVARHTAHIAVGRDAALRARVLARLEAGDRVDVVAAVEGCSIRFAARIYQAAVGELDAREALESEQAKPTRARRARPRTP